MGKGCKVVVCGQAAVGKTAILEQLLYGNHTVGKKSSWIYSTKLYHVKPGVIMLSTWVLRIPCITFIRPTGLQTAPKWKRFTPKI